MSAAPQINSHSTKAQNVGRVRLTGIGLWGPGFNSYSDYKVCNTIGEDAQADRSVGKPLVSLIPANERRRAPLAVKAAVSVCEEALNASGMNANDFACVFGSSMGDTDLTDYMCRVLAQDPAMLSPTKFHNSVHNAAAGYWTIASGCQQAANSVAAQEYTAGMALFEAVTQSIHEQTPVLLSLFDTAVSASYKSLYALDDSFACALALLPDSYQQQNDHRASSSNQPLFDLDMTMVSAPVPKTLTGTEPPSLNKLNNLSAEILALLDTLLTNKSATMSLALSAQSHLVINVKPISE